MPWNEFKFKALCEKAETLVKDATRENTSSVAKNAIRSQLQKTQKQLNDTILGFDKETFEEEAAMEVYRKAFQVDRDLEEAICHIGQVNNAAPAQQSTTKTAKLSKFDLKRFDGNIAEFKSFIQQFETVVGESEDYNDLGKFQHLLNVLDGEPKKIMEAYELRAENYRVAMNHLVRRYGDDQAIVQEHLHRLAKLPSVREVNDARGIRKLVDHLGVHCRALAMLKVPKESYCIMLAYNTKSVLPKELLLSYERNRTRNKGQVEPTEVGAQNNVALAVNELDELISFLESEATMIERVVGVNVGKAGPSSTYENSTSSTSRPTKLGSNPYEKPRKGGSAAALVCTTSAEQTRKKCVFCCENHPTVLCTSSKTVAQKKEKLRELKRCFKCTGENHSARQCYSKITCNCCKGYHATTLCERDLGDSKPSKTVVKAAEPQKSGAQGNACMTISEARLHNTLLPTAQCNAVSCASSRHTRILFDSGSQKSFIEESLAEELDLPVVGTEEISLYPFGETLAKTEVRRKVEITLRSTLGSVSRTIEAIVAPTICNARMPTIPVGIRDELVGQNKVVADEPPLGKETPPRISILIGAEHFWNFVKPNMVRLKGCKMFAIESIFGWSVLGESTKTNATNSGVCLVPIGPDAHDMSSPNLSYLWDLSVLGIAPNEDSTQELALKQCVESMSRLDDGRFEVRLPFKMGNGPADNRDRVERQLVRCVSRLLSNPTLLDQYHEAITEYMSKDFAEKVPDEEIGRTAYYLPHHAVIRADSDTTKCRIVFNASSVTSDGTSLNDHLDTGPNLNPELTEVLLKFRSYRIAMSADIEKAYLQISVAKEDRDFQRYFWFASKPCDLNNLPTIETYRMKSVLFGATSSTFLLASVLQSLFDSATGEHQEVAKLLKTSFYSDNLLVGGDDVNEAVRIYDSARHLLSSARLPIRKWSSNHTKLNDRFVHDKVAAIALTNVGASVLKVLGLIWDPESDTLSFRLDHLLGASQGTAPTTKRTALAFAASIFDPMGFTAPFVVRAKLLLQEMWQRNLPWDDRLPFDLQEKWNSFVEEVADLSEIAVPRYYFSNLQAQGELVHELHIFSDASPYAYGAVAYLRSTDCSGKVQISILMSKNRLSPQKSTTLTLPRLELMGILVATRLLSYLCIHLPTVRFNQCILWTDSSICVAWLAADATRWQPFVANRCREIKERLGESEIRYCPGKCNPADLVTRGVSARSLVMSNMWFHGPCWLVQSTSEWPGPDNLNHPDEAEVCREQLKSFAATVAVEDTVDRELRLSDLYSRLTTVVRIRAYVQRFIDRCRDRGRSEISKEISAEEFESSKTQLIRQCQLKHFYDEIEALRASKPVSRSSKLVTLAPYLDDHGILRIRSRLSNAGSVESNPILLPSIDMFTVRVIEHCHLLLHHAGATETMAEVRRHYWVLRCRRSVKRVTDSCVRCRREKARPAVQPIGQLPPERVNPSKPFAAIGLDYAGPLISDSGQKCYITLFTCASTRAIHLELSPSMNTSDFQQSLRRFIARRGLCSIVYSDNALSFKRTAADFAPRGIRWKFIPERAPWVGGFYERLVGCVKRSLKRALGTTLLSYRELETILIEVEAILNCRPLTYQIEDAEAPTALTPSHFLIGDRLTALPALKTGTLTSIELRKQYRIRDATLNRFWKQWRDDYIQSLRTAHHSPMRSAKPLAIGEVVLVYDKGSPRSTWKLARVVELFPGKDKIARVARVTVNSDRGPTVLRRATAHLYRLEVP